MKTMRRIWIGWGLLAALASAAWATGIEDFKLTKAVPPDVMVAVHTRSHAGLEFVHKQMERVWKKVEAQNFESDLKRLMRGMVEQSAGDPNAFEEAWTKFSDLAAAVDWKTLGEREFAYAMRLKPPFGSDHMYLMMPPADRVEADYKGLSNLLEQAVTMLPPNTLTLGEEQTVGKCVFRKVSLANSPMPWTLTLGRTGEVLLIGMGESLPDQALALLQGDSETKTLVQTERFQAAFKELPAPTDQMTFVDVNALIGSMGEMMSAVSKMSASQPADPNQPAVEPLKFLPALVKRFDLWDYIAAVSTTDGMKMTTESVTHLKPTANEKGLTKVFYGGQPLKEPLRYVPQEATSVSAFGGCDLKALYDEALNFLKTEVPDGEAMVAQWDQVKGTLPIDIEQDLLAWMGGGITTFTAPLPTKFNAGTVIMVEVKDPNAASTALAKLADLYVSATEQSRGAIEDSTIEGAEGFKHVILPAPFNMFIGEPMYGIKDGKLFLASNPKVLTAALDTAAGKRDGFAKNERFKEEGLPLPDNATGFSYQDLSNWGREMSQMLNMVGALGLVAPPELQKNPAFTTVLSIANKISRVLTEVNFYKSMCTVSSFKDGVSHSSVVLHYQEPPKPPTTPRTTEPAPDDSSSSPAEKPEAEKAPA